MKHIDEEASLGERGENSEGQGESSRTSAERGREPLTPTNFAKVEKSLAALGYFTPSSRRVRTGKVKKITFTREVDGKKVEVTAEIVPSALSGLPITADQDKYLAFQELITGIMQKEGKIANPIRFKSADLIRLLQNDTDAGKHYREISEWLDVMTSTTIRSQGVVWSAGQKRHITDRFHVFDRSVSVGKELEDGSIADANLVWLSSWQLDNINQKYLLPIDLESYRQLKNHIAKALVLHLQIWLFASHKAGSFEKRYEELCEILDITQHRAPSLISRQLKPSLDELVGHEYLEKWRIEKTSDRKAFKVVLFHGSKFHRDRRKRVEQKNRDRSEPIIVAESHSPDDPTPPEFGRIQATPEKANSPHAGRVKRGSQRPSESRGGELGPERDVEPVRASEMPDMVFGESERFGIGTPAGKVEAQSGADPQTDTLNTEGTQPTRPDETRAFDRSSEVERETRPVDRTSIPRILDDFVARGLMASAAMNLLSSLSADRVVSVRDYLDYWDEQKRKRDVGPGLLYDLIKNGDPLPATFITSRKLEAIKTAEERRNRLNQAKRSLERAYEEYQDKVLDRKIGELSPGEYDRQYQARSEAILSRGSFFERLQDTPLFKKLVLGEVRAEIRKSTVMFTFTEFCRQEGHHILAEFGVAFEDIGLTNLPRENDSGTDGTSSTVLQ